MIKELLKNSAKDMNALLRGHIKDIANTIGVDRQTVGRILKGEEGYSEDTITKVIEEAIKIFQAKGKEYLNEEAYWTKQLETLRERSH